MRLHAYYTQHIIHYILYTTYYTQHIIHYILYTTYYTQLIIHNILYTTYYTQHIIPTYAQISTFKLILKLLRHVSVLIHHLQGVYKLC